MNKKLGGTIDQVFIKSRSSHKSNEGQNRHIRIACWLRQPKHSYVFLDKVYGLCDENRCALRGSAEIENMIHFLYSVKDLSGREYEILKVIEVVARGVWEGRQCASEVVLVWG